MHNRVYFTEDQETRLAAARSASRKGLKTKKVKGYERIYARRLEGEDKRLALLEKLSDAVQSLCADIDRNGAMPRSGERRTVREVAEQLHDVFGVVPTTERGRR